MKNGMKRKRMKRKNGRKKLACENCSASSQKYLCVVFFAVSKFIFITY